MKLVVISAMWCGSCIKMKNILKDILKDEELNITNYDIDFDEEVKKYNVGDILPVIIFEKDNKEMDRLVGEKKKEEILNLIKKYK